MADAAAQALGAYIHHYSADVNRGAQAAGDTFSNAIASAPGVIGDNVGGFVHGLMTGQAPSVAAPAKGGKAAAPAAPAPGGPKAPVYTPTQLAAAPNAVDQYATDLRAAQAAAAANGGKAPAGWSAEALKGSGGNAGNVGAAAPTPLDVVRAAAMNNGGLSLSQLGALSESVARTVPQQVKPVPLTAKEQAISKYSELADTRANNVAKYGPDWEKSPVGAATLSMMNDLRPVVGQPNSVGDVFTAQQLAQGMPTN